MRSLRFSAGKALALLCALAFGAGLASAQTTGSIEGTVTDQSGGVLPGATVEVSGPQLQGTRVVATDSAGRFRVPALPPGNYKCSATLQGFTKVVRPTVVTLGSTATVNFQLQVSAQASVVVTGEAPLIDTRSAATGTDYSASVIGKLPVQRNYASIVLSQPGVQVDTGETQGNHLAISVYGTTSAENTYLINGVNTTNVIKGVEGKDINSEFVQEVQVITDGYMAEYGRGTGAVINVITKSGSNEFHGDAFGYYNTFGMQSKQKIDVTPNFSQSGDQVVPSAFNAPLVQTSDLARSEGGADVGGYFLKDRLWFFGAFDRTKDNQQFVTWDPSSQTPFPGSYQDDTVSTKVAGKLTANIASGSTLIASITTDPTKQYGASRTLAPNPSSAPGSYLRNQYSGGQDYSAQFLQVFGSMGSLSLQYGRHQDRFALKPSDNSTPLLVDNTGAEGPNGYAPVSSGGFGLVFGPISNNESKRDQVVGAFTAYLGNHEVKLGADYQNDETTGASFYSGGQALVIHDCLNNPAIQCAANAPTYTNSYGETIPVYYEHDYFTASAADLTPLGSAPFDVKTPMWSAYLQDSWRVLPNLTVNAGVRYDRELLKGGNGTTAISFKNEWAPRLGFVWDFLGDGTSKLYGSFGRFYYAIPTDLTVRVFTANTSVISYNYDPNSTTQDANAPLNQLIQVGSFAGEPIAPGLKAPYQDEYALGVEKAIDPTFSLGLKYTYRTLGQTIEDHCDLDPNGNPLGSSCAIANPGSNQPLANGTYPSCDNSANPTDPNANNCYNNPPTTLPGVPMPAAKRIFRGVQLMARKQFSHTLWAQFSYLYSTLKGNYSGAIREADGQTDPGINADYDYGVFLQNGYGYLDLDRRHQFRLDGVYTTPFGLTVGLGAYARSGTPLSKLGLYNAFYPDNLYLTQRGTAGRTPWDYEANLNLAYDWKLSSVTITPEVFIFNLLNRQTPILYNQDFNPNSSFVTNTSSPFYGQAGIEPGQGNCPSTATAPCSDNPSYRKVTLRTDPRSIRVALKISF